MEIPQGNFFQVTINSNKLINLIQSLTHQVNQLDNKTTSFQKSVQSLLTSVVRDKKYNEEIRLAEAQKVKRMLFQESNYNRLFLKETDKKMSQKFQQNQHMFTLFDNRITFIKNNIQHDMAIKDTFFDEKIIKYAQKMAQTMDKKIIQSTLKTNESIYKLQNQLKDLSQKYLQISDKLNKQEIQDTSSIKSISIKSISRQNIKSKKRIKIKRNGTFFQQQQQFKQIKQKLVKFQAKLIKSERKIQKNKAFSHQKIVRINEKKNTVNFKDEKQSEISEMMQKQMSKSNKSHKSNKSFKQSNNKQSIDITTKRQQIQETIHAKLNLIQNYLCQKIDGLQKHIIKINNKNDIFKQQVSIILRRIQKNKDQILDIKQILKMREEKLIDDKCLDKMKNQIAKISKELDQIGESKVSYDYFQKQKSKLNEKMANLKQVLGQKAQKYDVKKGFSFLQDKVKDIIVVLTEDKNQTRDSATKKLPFKCLSCDKNLDFPSSQATSQNHSRLQRQTVNPISSIRSTTTLIRKRKRAAHSSIVNDQY